MRDDTRAGHGDWNLEDGYDIPFNITRNGLCRDALQTTWLPEVQATLQPLSLASHKATASITHIALAFTRILSPLVRPEYSLIGHI